jgi:GDP-mannose 4,6-dehydratase
LVTGGAGQDGWHLIELLLSRGYEVFAHSRRPVDPGLHAGRVSWHTGDLTDETFLKSLLSVSKPDEIYNLAAASRPALSWNIPIETALLNALVPQRICEFIRRELPATRLFQASSSEIYGDSQAQLQDEQTRANPKSPYGISKAYAHQIIGAYRQQYRLHLSCGILSIMKVRVVRSVSCRRRSPMPRRRLARPDRNARTGRTRQAHPVRRQAISRRPQCEARFWLCRGFRRSDAPHPAK